MVNVDTVYQTVQALANKEQRGYLTPQEFNLFANQAQQDIFEQYFYDLNAFRLKGVQSGTGEEFELGDSTTMIREKIKRTNGVTYTSQMNLTHTGGGHYRFPVGRNGKLYGVRNNAHRTLRTIDPDEFNRITGSRWSTGTGEWFVFDEGYGELYVRNMDGGPVVPGPNVPPDNAFFCENVVGKPGLVYWGYIIVNEDATYNPPTSKDFDLPGEEQPDLVVKILKYLF